MGRVRDGSSFTADQHERILDDHVAETYFRFDFVFRGTINEQTSCTASARSNIEEKISARTQSVNAPVAARPNGTRAGKIRKRKAGTNETVKQRNGKLISKCIYFHR